MDAERLAISNPLGIATLQLTSFAVFAGSPEVVASAEECGFQLLPQPLSADLDADLCGAGHC